jgi:tetratricopeptide (TPR) repeat protein
MGKKHITLLLICLVTSIFLACTSLSLKGDIFIDSHREQVDSNLAKLEETIVPLEAAGGTEARRQQSDITSARQMISEMEKETSADADYSGRLIAWSGRLAILEGRYSEAQRLYRQSIAVSPGNITAVILGIRLEGDPEKRLLLVDAELAMTSQNTESYGELQIEKGRSLIELNRFSEAAGAFDAAFASGLNNVYRESYEAGRNRSWELRNTVNAAAGTLDVLGRDSITWRDCIAIAKNETQLLRFISGGRDISETEFFTRLLDRGFIPYTQDITVSDWPSSRPAGDEPVTRSGAAWFIWHLYAEARADRGLLSRYSARYATGLNPRSPIADVPPLSPFFDSILGCVETELLSLPDGRNFRPSEPIRGAELLAILRRIDG